MNRVPECPPHIPLYNWAYLLFGPGTCYLRSIVHHFPRHQLTPTFRCVTRPEDWWISTSAGDHVLTVFHGGTHTSCFQIRD